MHGCSALSAGLRPLPFAAGVMLAAPVSTVLVARFGARRTAVTALPVPQAA